MMESYETHSIAPNTKVNSKIYPLVVQTNRGRIVAFCVNQEQAENYLKQIQEYGFITD